MGIIVREESVFSSGKTTAQPDFLDVSHESARSVAGWCLSGT